MLFRGARSPFHASRAQSTFFVLSGLFVLLALLIVSSNRLGWFKPSLRVSLITRSSLGLVSGAPVRVSGIYVGVVDDVGLLDDGRVRFNLKIDDRFRTWVTPRSLAFLSRPSLLGSGGVEITPAPMERRRVPNHFSIPAQTTPDLEGLLAGATTIQADLQALIRSSNRIADKDLPQTIQELAMVFSTANKMGTTVNGALTPAMNQLQGTLRQGQQTTQLFGRELPPTMEQLRNTLGVIRRTGDSADQAARQSQQSLQKLEPELKQSLEEFSALMRKINGYAARFESLLEPATPSQLLPPDRQPRPAFSPPSADALPPLDANPGEPARQRAFSSKVAPAAISSPLPLEGR